MKASMSVGMAAVATNPGSMALAHAYRTSLPPSQCITLPGMSAPENVYQSKLLVGRSVGW